MFGQGFSRTSKVKKLRVQPLNEGTQRTSWFPNRSKKSATVVPVNDAELMEVTGEKLTARANVQDHHRDMTGGRKKTVRLKLKRKLIESLDNIALGVVVDSSTSLESQSKQLKQAIVEQGYSLNLKALIADLTLCRERNLSNESWMSLYAYVLIVMWFN